MKWMLISVFALSLSACASTSSLPRTAGELKGDLRTGDTNWAQRQDVMIVRGIDRDMAFRAARAGLRAGSFSEASASNADGAVIGRRGMTLNDWNVVGGVYFTPFQDGFMFHARSQGSYDIGYAGDTTGDDWPRRMLNGVRLFILTETPQSKASSVIIQ